MVKKNPTKNTTKNKKKQNAIKTPSEKANIWKIKKAQSENINFTILKRSQRKKTQISWNDIKRSFFENANFSKR